MAAHIQRVALVTGAGHGLGQAYALDLAHHEYAVVVNDVATDDAGTPLAETVAEQIRASGGNAVAAPTTIATEDGAGRAVDIAMSTYGRIDVLINNAGIVRSGPIGDVSPEVLHDVFDVHVRGSYTMIRTVLPDMLARGGGRLINTISNSVLGMTDIAAYAAAKGALIGMTRALAVELRGTGVTINAVAPMALTNPGRTGQAATSFDRLGPRAGAAWVSPLVTHLASDACTASGELYSAVGGRYARLVLGVSRGWMAEGDRPPSPQQVAGAMAEVRDLSAIEILDGMLAEVDSVANRLPPTPS